MRVLPAGWPDPSELVSSPPKVYLHVADGVWPPASVQDGESLPAGWSLVGEWSIDADLDAPLLPGQVNAASNFTIATASCTIPQPVGGLSAPWRAGGERTPSSGHAELVASHDGYNGSTAFTLGTFLLDPVKGKLSEPWLNLTMVQDLARLRRPHGVKSRINRSFAYSPSEILQERVEACGFVYDATAAFSTRVSSSYFKGDTDELKAWQEIVAANLGALYLSMDGVTVRVLDPDYLLGTGPVLQTLEVLDSLDDLSWSQDPNAAVDRIEVTWQPPSYDDDADDGGGGMPSSLNGGEVWVAPKGTRIDPGDDLTVSFDPGGAAHIGTSTPRRFETGYTFKIWANSSKYGVGSDVLLSGDATQFSSGKWSATITNDTGVVRFLVAPTVPPPSTANPSYSRGTKSWIPGVIDRSSDQTKRTLTWGKSESQATNALTFDLGRNIQTTTDARAILDRIVTRISNPSYVVEDVRIVPDLRRELGDLYRLQMPAAGFNVRAMVTGMKTSGGPGGVEQSLTIAAMPLRVADFNEAWEAHNPAATIADWNALWVGKTIAEYNADPLKTS